MGLEADQSHKSTLPVALLNGLVILEASGSEQLDVDILDPVVARLSRPVYLNLKILCPKPLRKMYLGKI